MKDLYGSHAFVGCYKRNIVMEIFKTTVEV